MSRRWGRASGLIEHNLVKRRLVYVFPTPILDQPAHGVEMCSLAAGRSVLEGVPLPAQLTAQLQQPRDHDGWWLFYIVEDGAVLGYGLLHAPQVTQWHDSLPTHPGEARLAAGFVDPELRGRRIHARLLQARADFCGRRGLVLWGVVERANRSSRQSLERAGGRPTRTNVLVKAVGANVVSVLTRPTRAHWVLRRNGAR